MSLNHRVVKSVRSLSILDSCPVIRDMSYMFSMYD